MEFSKHLVVPYRNKYVRINKINRTYRKKCMNLPSKAMTPHKVHTIRLRPTEPLLCSTPFGEIKIPEPEMNKMEGKY